MANLGIFRLEFFHEQSFMQMLCLGIFGLEFKKVIVIYEISTLKVTCKKKKKKKKKKKPQIWDQKKKKKKKKESPNLGPKKTYSKLYANKFLTFGVKKTDLGNCGLEFENAIVIFEISTLKIG